MPQSVTTIQGDRVLLRPSEEGDAEEAARVWTPELRYMYGGSRTAARRPTAEQRRRGLAELTADEARHFFCIEADGRFIGHVDLTLKNQDEGNASYRIGIVYPEYWGRGCGTEAARLMLRYAFATLGLHRVHLRVAAYNLRARRSYEKTGFRVEGILRQNFQVEGEWQDDVLMAILREEWEAMQAPPCSEGEITLRHYHRADHAEAIALWEAVGFHLGGNDPADIIARKLATQPGFFLVAECDGKLVGTVIGSLERGWGWVQRLAVHPDYRRRGIARRLMQEAESARAALGAYRACLLTHRENAAATELYQSLGYEAWEQVLVMSRELTTPTDGAGG